MPLEPLLLFLYPLSYETYLDQYFLSAVAPGRAAFDGNHDEGWIFGAVSGVSATDPLCSACTFLLVRFCSPCPAADLCLRPAYQALDP